MFDARLLALVATTAASHSDQANAPPFFFLVSFFLRRRFIWRCERDVPAASTGLIDRTRMPREGARRLPPAAWHHLAVGAPTPSTQRHLSVAGGTASGSIFWGVLRGWGDGGRGGDCLLFPRTGTG